MEIGSSPTTVTSSKSIKYRPSGWRVHEFEVCSGNGGAVCRAAALLLEGSVLVWLGAGGGAAPRLVEAALGMPVPTDTAGAAPAPRAALATALFGVEGSATSLARRLAASLARSVFVCCGTTFDRFTLPLVEQALVDELIKRRPKCMTM